MTTRNERWTGFRDQQRDEIAKAVIAAVANTHGEPLNVTEVVNLAGISRKTFYKYFDTLSTALVYAQGLVQREMTTLAIDSVSDAPNGRERFLGMMYYFANVGRQHPELIRFVNYFDYTFRHEGLGPVQGTRHPGQAYASDEIAQSFRDGQSDGSICRDLESATSIFAAGNSIMGLVQRSQIIGRHGDPELTRASIDLLVEVWREHLTPAGRTRKAARRSKADKTAV
jgi:AcrR family transcriptional regulator